MIPQQIFICSGQNRKGLRDGLMSIAQPLLSQSLSAAVPPDGTITET